MPHGGRNGARGGSPRISACPELAASCNASRARELGVTPCPRAPGSQPAPTPSSPEMFWERQKGEGPHLAHATATTRPEEQELCSQLCSAPPHTGCCLWVVSETLRLSFNISGVHISVPHSDGLQGWAQSSPASPASRAGTHFTKGSLQGQSEPAPHKRTL